jgi:polysaccharide export outer membrane protein
VSMRRRRACWGDSLSRRSHSGQRGDASRFRLGFLATILSLTAISWGPAASAAPPQAAAASQDPAVAEPEYRIGAGDVLQVFVWKEPDFTREVTVRLDGRITFPLLGNMMAAGLTPTQLAADITSKLGRFVDNPSVTLSVAQSNSLRFYVIGQVKQSGAFPFVGRTTILQALAMAGGLVEFAKKDHVLVFRGPPGAQEVLTVDVKKIESSADVSQNIALQPGDTILVP